MTESSPRQIDLMMNATEDSNETLFYIQDVLSSGDENINRMLRNALLHYAYLPLVVRSLCSMRLKPVLTINTCLYVLTQTFRILQDSEFLGLLYSTLFAAEVPRRVVEAMEPKDGVPASPKFYSQKYRYRTFEYYSLEEYLIEYYNLHNVEVFLMHGSANFKFIKDLRTEYEAILTSASLEKMSVETQDGFEAVSNPQ